MASVVVGLIVVIVLFGLGLGVGVAMGKVSRRHPLVMFAVPCFFVGIHITLWLFDWFVHYSAFGIFYNAFMACLWAYAAWVNRPRRKRKKLRKAVGEKTRQIIEAMSAFVKAGTRLKPA